MLKKQMTPLYYQLETILRGKIVSGEVKPGSQLPSEEVLATEYGVSRITVRQALSALQKDGLIIRKKGKGTYVSRKRILLNPLKFIGSVDDLVCMGIDAITRVLGFEVIRKPENEGDLVDALVDNALVCIQRLRLVKGLPYCYILNYLPLDIGQRIEPESLAAKALLQVLEEDLKIRPAKALQTFEATIADNQMAALLETRVGAPLLKIERVCFNSKKRAIEYVRVLYTAEKYLFSIKLKRKGPLNLSEWNLDY